MEGSKVLHSMEEVIWKLPLLTFLIERHGGTVLGSIRADLQRWTINVEEGTAVFEKAGLRQPAINVKAVAEETARLIEAGGNDTRFERDQLGRVRVRIGKVLPTGSAVKQILAGRRKRFKAALSDCLQVKGWVPCWARWWRKEHRTVKGEARQKKGKVDQKGRAA